jgi:hypothetical protein
MLRLDMSESRVFESKKLGLDSVFDSSFSEFENFQITAVLLSSTEL